MRRMKGYRPQRLPKMIFLLFDNNSYLDSDRLWSYNYTVIDYTVFDEGIM